MTSVGPLLAVLVRVFLDPRRVLLSRRFFYVTREIPLVLLHHTSTPPPFVPLVSSLDILYHEDGAAKSSSIVVLDSSDKNFISLFPSVFPSEISPSTREPCRSLFSLGPTARHTASLRLASDFP